MKRKFHFYQFQFLIILTISNLFANKPNWIPVVNLPKEKTVIVDSIIIHINNALEGSRVNTKIENSIFNMGNRFHFKTQSKTIKKHLLFKTGEQISSTILIESERNLRNQVYFADAKIEIDSISSYSVVAHVTVFDQWSTLPIVGLKRIGKQWISRFGIRENNFLGTGQVISFANYQDITTKGTTLGYYNSSFTNNRLQLMFQFTDNSEGYHFSSSIRKPLISKYDKNSFQIRYMVSKTSDWYYYDGNLLNSSNENNLDIGETNRLVEFKDIFKKSMYFDFTKSYGFDQKMNIRFFGKINEINQGSNNVSYLNAEYADYLPDNLIIPVRDDVLLGMEFQLYTMDYAQTNNLTNVKWIENISQIKYLSFTLGRNILGFGAKNNNLLLEWEAKYSDFFKNKHFVFVNSNLKYYLTPSGKKENGSFDSKIHYQYKFTSLANGKISTYWKNYIGRSLYEQLLLGESSGLYGYPNFYYSGSALLLINAELTQITNIEIMTIIPAISIFASTGNTFTDYNHIDLNTMHSSIGFGLRFGLTRSAGSIVNHINFSWPLDDSMKGPTISIHSKNSL